MTADYLSQLQSYIEITLQSYIVITLTIVYRNHITIVYRNEMFRIISICILKDTLLKQMCPYPSIS